MKPLPCPKCGSENTVGTFCTTCLRELHPLIKSVKDVKLVMCVSCENVKHKGTWKQRKDPVRDVMQHALVPAEDGTVSDISCATPDFERKPGIKKKTTVQVTVTGRHEDATQDYSEEYAIPLSYEVTLCPKCKKQGTMYFEGVLQARNETEDTKRAIQAYVKKHEGVHISKTAPLPNGTDYFLTDHRAVQQLAQHLHKHFGGELKVNAQHFSRDRQASKTLYRTNAFVSLPEYAKGDVVLIADAHFLITGLVPKVKGTDLRTGESTSFQYRVGAAQKLPQLETKVVDTAPLLVLHPTTYEPVTPVNVKKVTLDTTVTVAVDGDQVFLL